MSDYNYIITVDENGSPSLAHAWGMKKGGMKKDHQWFARERVNDKWRYWYDPESYRRWAQGGVRKVKQAANDVKKAAGNAADEVRKSVNARRELNEANKSTGFGSGLKQWNAQRKYNNTAMGRAEKAVRDAADDLGDRARGLATTAQGRARKAIDEARNDIGRSASEATKTARKKIKNLTDAVQEHGNKALSELREAAGNVIDKAEGAARDAGARTRKAVEDKSGVTDQKNRDEARRRALMGLDDAAGDYADSDNRYQKSAKGRADKAVAGAKNAAGRARDAAEEAIGTTARKDFDEARRRASMGTDDPMDNYSDRENAYNKSIRGRIENAPKNARDLANKASQAVKNAVTSQEKKDFDEARRRASMGTDDPLDNYSDRERAYNRTARGRAEQAARDIADTASDIRDRIRGLADSVGSSARNAASRAQNAADEVTGANAKKEMDAAGRRAMMGLDDAIGSFVDAQTRYDNSAGGRASSAASNAQASLKAAQSAAKKALAKAMDYLPEEQIEEIKELIRGK